ncbi:hypothetical protein [Ulvibacterium sp.]|uniref:hypothetical protein n=1 Tax=Ulvibacterium sp. TaxID=2665914 RepID=UPI003BAABA9C
MKKSLSLLGFVLLAINVLSAQEFSTNRNPVGLEYNILFNSDTRYVVSQTGSAVFNLPLLFDGTLIPNYPIASPSDLDPTVILIEDLPDAHIQAGAWVGWTTRYWYPSRFKIEGYDSHSQPNSWKVLADYSTQNYTGGHDFSVALPDGSFTKLRFTFYEATGTNGRMGLSEIYFIHPEATSPYESLLGVGALGLWNNVGANINYAAGNVGIGTSTIPNGYRLAVDGKVISEEVKVQLSGDWPDYVFSEDYTLPTLEEVQKHIQEHGHLPNIPSAQEMEENGVELGIMNMKLLEKIEELTLYILNQEKKIKDLQGLEDRIKALESNGID